MSTVSEWLVAAVPYLAALALLIAIAAFLHNLSLKRRLSRLMQGRNGSVEETLAIVSRELKELKKFRAELETYLKSAELRLRGSLSGLGVVRFNPFSGDGSGGNQSFAIAILDEEHSGVVLSSLYARDRVGMYAKPVENGKPSFTLSKEEHEALEKAKVRTGERKKKS
jgi:hypothetical protein